MKQSKLIQAFEMDRKDMKLTQVEVIEKAGLNPKVRGNIYRNLRSGKISLNDMLSLCKALGFSVNLVKNNKKVEL